MIVHKVGLQACNRLLFTAFGAVIVTGFANINRLRQISCIINRMMVQYILFCIRNSGDRVDPDGTGEINPEK